MVLRKMLAASLFLTILEVTCHAYPFSNGVDCDRDCDDDPSPRVCYYHWTFEEYTTLGAACDLCTPNATNYVVNDCTCVRANGVERSILTANRMIPGPAIYACRGDKLVVDVTNKMSGMETTIHWHGMHQRGTQFYDGVPYVTQCPILHGTTFRYQYWAHVAGTFFWHSHAGLQKLNGITGSLVIKQCRISEPSGHLYDEDSWRHVIFLQDWFDERVEENFPGNLHRDARGQLPATFLINGLGKSIFNGSWTSSPYARFSVESGKRYRFRIINACGSHCPVALTISDHDITLIGADLSSVKPKPAKTIVSMTGERYDFILEANQTAGCYWIMVKGIGQCAAHKVYQLAVLSYDGANCDLPNSAAPTYDSPFPQGIIINPVMETSTQKVPNSVRLTELENNAIEGPDILNMTPERTFFIPLGTIGVDDVKSFFRTDFYENFYVIAGLNVYGLMSNISYHHPRAPLLTQYDEIDPDTICDYSSCNEKVCFCTNVLKLKLGEVVDIFFIDIFNFTGVHHPIHVHGVDFYVLNMGFANDLNATEISMDVVEHAVADGNVPPGSQNPIMKDVVSLNTNGYAHIRFIASNPGFWFVHCHIGVHIATGLDMVLQVGELSDIPQTPKGFPKCTDFTPEIDLDKKTCTEAFYEVNFTGVHHPIHVHGVDFYVLNMGFASNLNAEEISMDVVTHAVAEGNVPPGSQNPIMKDVVSLNTNGYAHIRFIASNPGFWFVHCHIGVHIATGLDMVLQVGELSDIPPTPKGFPKCTDFTPEIDLSTKTCTEAFYEGDYCSADFTCNVKSTNSVDSINSVDSTNSAESTSSADSTHSVDPTNSAGSTCGAYSTCNALHKDISSVGVVKSVVGKVGSLLG